MKKTRKREWEGEVLTRWQMARLYREAADKRQEIQILHEITLLPCEEVRRVLEEEGCCLPRKRRAPGEGARQKAERALFLWEQGNTLEEVAGILGVCRSTAVNYIRLGKKMRAARQEG